MSGKSVLTFFAFIGVADECVYSGFMGRCESLSLLVSQQGHREEAAEARGALDGSHSRARWQEPRAARQAVITSCRGLRGATVHNETLKRYNAKLKGVFQKKTMKGTKTFS